MHVRYFHPYRLGRKIYDVMTGQNMSVLNPGSSHPPPATVNSELCSNENLTSPRRPPYMALLQVSHILVKSVTIQRHFLYASQRPCRHDHPQLHLGAVLIVIMGMALSLGKLTTMAKTLTIAV